MQSSPYKKKKKEVISNNIINKGFKKKEGRDSGESSQAIGSIRTQNLGHRNENNYLYVQMADTEICFHVISDSNLNGSLFVAFDVLKTTSCLTSIAAIVFEGAVDKVLLTEGDEVSSLELMLPLQGACGAEGPAGAARALVLDARHAALGSPVYLIGKLRTSCNELRSGVRVGRGTEAIVNFGEFAIIKVTELVHFQRVGEFGRVFIVHVDVFLVRLQNNVAS